MARFGDLSMQHSENSSVGSGYPFLPPAGQSKPRLNIAWQMPLKAQNLKLLKAAIFLKRAFRTMLDPFT
jgi:hypothetical protein